MQRLSPETLFKPTAYSQVVVTSGRRMVFIAGQVSNDAQGNLVAAGDFAGQSSQVFSNLPEAPKAAGAAPGDVTQITVYGGGDRPELLPALREARAAAFPSWELPAPT